jgi:hypothetical protein
VFLFAIALVFYVVAPLLGAWQARRDWTRFREAVFRAVRSPEADLSLLQTGSSMDFRLTGRLEAFEGRDRLWIGGERVSAAVSLRGTPVYFLDEEPPRRVDASALGALPEGTPFLVAGPLTGKPGQAHFAAAPGRDLLVLAFEGDPSTALERAVSSGRPRVDIWNRWTPIALGVGFALLLILAYADLKPEGNRSEGTVALGLALLPSTFFLPPGIFCVLGFIRLWAQARVRRATSDAGRLSGTFTAARGAGWREGAAYALLLAGIAANAALLLAGLKFWIP